MQELEKILEEIDEIYVDDMGCGVDCNLEGRSKLPCHNCYECIKDVCKEIIRKHLTDGWVPVDDRLPEEEVSVLAQWEKYDKYLNVKLIYLDVMWLDDAEKKVFETINGVPNGKVIAWQPLPEPYQPERSAEE